VNLHPPSVHFPIALLTVAGAFYVWAFLRENESAFKAATLLHTLGILGVIVSVVLGKVASSSLEMTPGLDPLLRQHEVMAYGILWSFGMLWLWQYLRNKSLGSAYARRERVFFVLIFCISWAFMAYSAHLGGKMVYEEGAGVNITPETLSE